MDGSCFFIVVSWQNKTLAIPRECCKVCFEVLLCYEISKSGKTALYNTGISQRQSCSSLSACHVRALGWMVFIHYLRSKYEREALPRVYRLGNWGLERWGSLLKLSGSSCTCSPSQVRMQAAHEPSIFPPPVHLTLRSLPPHSWGNMSAPS